MERNTIKIGKRIRSIREKLGMTSEEFAELFDPPASKGTVSKWENGRYLPNNKRLVKIARLGNISVEELLYGEKLEIQTFNSGEEFENARQKIINEILLNDDLKNSEAFSELQKTLSDISIPAPNEEERSFINNKTTLIEELDKQHAQFKSELDEFLTLIKTETDEKEKHLLSSQISQNYEILEYLEEAKLKLISNPEFKFYVHNKVIYLIVNKDELTVDDVKFNASQYDNLIVRKNGEEIVHLTNINNDVLIDTIKKYHDWNTSIVLTVNAWFKMIDRTQHI
ncbi:helix-turn-helix transcriptional regulator [Aerococcaceae bacterium DSM 111176]|nr:helix-turn-helix transcriptional regulator [Aerococcaceae bacterium DSM 111176]